MVQIAKQKLGGRRRGISVPQIATHCFNTLCDDGHKILPLKTYDQLWADACLWSMQAQVDEVAMSFAVGMEMVGTML